MHILWYVALTAVISVGGYSIAILLRNWWKWRGNRYDDVADAYINTIIGDAIIGEAAGKDE